MVDSESVDRVLRDTRTHFLAPAESRAQVRAALVARGALSALPGGARLAASGRAGVAKSTAALLAGLTFAMGFWLGGQRGTAPELATTTAPRSPLLTLTAPAPSEAAAKIQTGTEASAARPNEPAFVPAPRTPAHARLRRDPRAAHRAADPDASGSAELALLQRAERALRAGTPELALSFLDDLDQRYPKTPFVEERTAARLMARCAHGEPAARSQAALFLSEHPSSVYSGRVQELCQLAVSSRVRDGSLETGH